MKRFSKTLPITKGNLKGIREDKPAYYNNFGGGDHWARWTRDVRARARVVAGFDIGMCRGGLYAV